MRNIDVIRDLLAQEMKLWLVECFHEDYQEEIMELTYEEAYENICKSYEGGIKAFLEDLGI